jgi:hypothetical protein
MTTVEERLARLETHMEYVHPTIKAIRDDQILIRDKVLAGEASDSANRKLYVKLASVGGVAGGAVTSLVGFLVSNGWLKLPVSLALAIALTTPADAIIQRLDGPSFQDRPVVAWRLTVKACAASVCKTMIEKDHGSELACEDEAARIIELVPQTDAVFWGFAPDKPAIVTPSCRAIYGDQEPA